MSADPVEEFKSLMAFIPQVEAGYDPQTRRELVRRLRELAMLVPPHVVTDEAKAYLAQDVLFPP